MRSTADLRRLKTELADVRDRWRSLPYSVRVSTGIEREARKLKKRIRREMRHA